jgi:hypothetical protein
MDGFSIRPMDHGNLKGGPPEEGGFITSRNNSHHRFRCPCRRQSV